MCPCPYVSRARYINETFFQQGIIGYCLQCQLRVGEIWQFCREGEEGQRLMRAAMSQLNLSARAYHRTLKLARTTADLAGCEDIQSVHLAALTVCFAKALHAHLHCAQAQVSQSSKVDDVAMVFRQTIRVTCANSVRNTVSQITLFPIDAC